VNSSAQHFICSYFWRHCHHNTYVLIQFTSFLIYLHANSTAQGPITKWAWVKETNTHEVQWQDNL
jgi:hypothetical protein